MSGFPGISLEDYFEKSSDLIQIMDENTNILYANPRWQARLGYDARVTTPLHFLQDILTSPFHALFQAALSRLQSEGDVEDIHLILKSQNGEEIAIDGQLIANRTDGRWTILCIFRETAHNQQSHTELERMFAMSVDMLGVVDFEGYFTRLNPAWERILGYSLEELLGKPFISFIHPDDVERTQQEYTRSTQINKVRNFENRYLCKDGRVKWISWHYISYPDLKQIYFVAHDITDDRANQELLQETRDRLQAILDNSGTLIALKNLDAKYILVNQEFADIFADGNKSALINKTDKDIFSPLSLQKLIEHDAAVLSEQRSLQFEENIRIEDSTRTFITTRFLLHDNDDKPY